jgi:pimeloyl-ACP methyl ester carboxylesterase
VDYRSVFVQTAFGATHVLVSGREGAPAVLLLHPAHSNSALWINNIRALSKTHRVYAIDIIGDAGKSELEAELPFGFDRPWLLQIMDSLFIDRTDVVAVSRACQMATNLACYVPKRIGRLILVSASLSGVDQEREVFRNIRKALRFPTPRKVSRLFADLAPSLPAEHELVAYQSEVYRSSRYPTYPVYDPQKFGGCGPSAPTLLLIGEKESVYDPEVVRRLSGQVFSEVTVQTVPSVGHLMTIESPEIVNSIMMCYLDGMVAGQSA